MDNVQVYEIALSASPNSEKLFSPGRKYFYWDDKKFKKMTIGEKVFFINRTKRFALFTEIDKLDIQAETTDENSKFTDEGFEFGVIGSYNKFVRFKIIEEKAIDRNWTWKNLGSAEATYLAREDVNASDINTVRNNIERIGQLLSVYNDPASLSYQLLIKCRDILKSQPAIPNPEPLEVPEMFKITEFAERVTAANLKFPIEHSTRFVSALCTKPFVILTGLSGSGKTKLAQAFAQWICEGESQYCIVPVGADWTNREPLLGYPNALEENKYIKPDNGVLHLIIEAGKEANLDKPYFLILDEMNLSHVERYFADFLSAMESEQPIPLHNGNAEWDGVPPNLKLPENLFVIGTVNIDETTYMFSPKVLDRANVIEFRVSESEMGSFLDNPAKPDMSKLQGTGRGMGADFVQQAKAVISDFEDKEAINSVLLEFFIELKKIGAEFGYRTASEIYRFAGKLNRLTANEGGRWELNDVIDAAVMQKLLPKVHGSRSKLDPILKALAGLCLTNRDGVDELLKEPEKIVYTDREKVRFPISLEKIIRMKKRAVQDGFTSFAEA